MPTEHSDMSSKTLKAFIEASAAINSSLEMEEVLQAIAYTASKVMDAEASSVMLLNEENGMLEYINPKYHYLLKT